MDKTELFCKIVFDIAVSDGREEIDKLKKKNDDVLNCFEDESVIRINQYLEKINRKAQQDSLKIISKAKAEGTKRILKKKADLICEFHTYLQEVLKDIVSGEDYREFFEQNLASAKKKISENDSVKLVVRKEDQPSLKKESFEIEVSERISGGFLMIINDEISYDYSLEAKLLEMSERINSMLENIMENHSGEKNDKDE